MWKSSVRTKGSSEKEMQHKRGISVLSLSLAKPTENISSGSTHKEWKYYQVTIHNTYDRCQKTWKSILFYLISPPQCHRHWGGFLTRILKQETKVTSMVLLKPPHVASYIHIFYRTEVWYLRYFKKIVTQHNWVQIIYHHKLLVTYFDRKTVLYPSAVTNNTTIVNAPSANDLRAAFMFSRFDPIVGEPSYETLFKLENQATRNAATVVIRLPPPHMTLSGIVKQPAVYILRVGSHFLTAAISWRRSTFSCRSNTFATPEYPSRIWRQH